MHIEFVEIANFRKLISTRVGLSSDKTLFVGANNSGKTSAITAMRLFLLQKERASFSFNDFTISNWPTVNVMGAAWEAAFTTGNSMPTPAWDQVLPTLDVWLNVRSDELRYVRKILPTLDWEGGRLGVRVRYEPIDPLKLQEDYVKARSEALALQEHAREHARGEGNNPDEYGVTLWPQDLVDFLRRKLRSYFTHRYYVLDPSAVEPPLHGRARPQPLPSDDPIDGDPFKEILRIDEISAQRGFGHPADAAGDEGEIAVAPSTARKLSTQLRQYYARHLDPSEHPNSLDLMALRAIEAAQKAFDLRLEDGFQSPLREVHSLGYPGVTDPKLCISTRLRPIDGLDHEAAVRFEIPLQSGENSVQLHLPEESNGLGYQNLISMIFRLMAFRDSWMQVGKAKHKVDDDDAIPPIHLVLIEEPEVHLHTQVQQVFIRQAYKVLRNHASLGNLKAFSTQVVVSTHSSHIAHECSFDSLRYFRRVPGADGQVPTSCVVNLSDVFGTESDTKRFVTRYLKVTHCDPCLST